MKLTTTPRAGLVASMSGALFLLPTMGQTAVCASVAACVLGSNVGAGAGVEALSQNYFGLYAASTNGRAVEGRSTNSYGVEGITQASGVPGAGVLGVDEGYGPQSSGVIGLGGSDTGVTGLASSGAGVVGESQSAIGVLGKGASGVTGIGNDYAYGYGVTGQGSFGVVGTGYDWGGAFVGTGLGSGLLVNLAGGNADVAALDVYNTTAVYPKMFLLLGGLVGNVASIDGAGNEVLSGTLTADGTELFRTKSRSGIDVESFGARSASPTIDDLGTATLRNGVASVPLDATFASAIDTRNSYMVFITPHGDSNGLYTVLGPTGFTVHENKAGRSTLSFDYRIVAKPLDAPAAHLPAMAPRAKGVPPRLPISRFIAPTVSLSSLLE